MTPSAVIQVKPGIGDVIWHLPFIRAVAAASPGGKVTFLTPPSSRAKELLEADPSIAEIIYFEHGGSALKRGLNQIRLMALLRRHRFQTLWIFDRTTRPALAAWLAGIPRRIGLGLGRQRHFITNPGIDDSHRYDWPTEWLTALLAAMKVPLPTTEPRLKASPALLAATNLKFGAWPRPWIVVGIGSRDPWRDWPNAAWREFVLELRLRTHGTVFVTGSADDQPRAQQLIAQSDGAPAVNECGLPIPETMALLALADLYVGPNSGLLNIAAAMATPAFGLFGTMPPFTYSRFFHAILPDDGMWSSDGMNRISPRNVIEHIAPHINQSKLVT